MNSSRAAFDALDTARIREDFPILKRLIDGHRLVYLDSAATSQKPRAVIDAIIEYYEKYNSNVHRGVHRMSVEATTAYERARRITADFVGAASSEEIIFTRSATEAINLVAHAWGTSNIRAGDEILITTLEHHSNIVPWQQLCQRTGGVLRVVPIDDEGSLVEGALDELIGSRTRLVAVTQVSNSLGTVLDVHSIVKKARAVGAAVLIDGAQAVPHMPVDVGDIDCDFYALSGHKMYGPTGIGALWGRGSLLETMSPWQGGGDMIRSVTFEHTEYADPPYRFEAGTQDIAGAIGLAAAIEYLQGIGLEAIGAHEAVLLALATERLKAIPEVRIIGTAPRKAGVLSFLVKDIHPHDVGTIMDAEGIAVRTGHHCAHPVMQRFDTPAMTRISFAMYNTAEEVECFAEALARVPKVFAP